MLTETDLIYGCKSGLQKAVRRGDLPLGKHCFDFLWGNRVQKVWVKWRLPILIIEEVFFLCGELAKFLKSETEDRKEWWKFYSDAILAKKNKDASSIAYLGRLDSDIDHPELNIMRRAFSKENPSEGFGEALDLSLKHRKNLSGYEQDALSILEGRVKANSFLIEKWFCVGGVPLLFLRGLDEGKVKSALKNKTPGEGDHVLPWYVFDMHTRIGSSVLSICERRYSLKWHLNREELRRVWFICESNWVTKAMMDFGKVRKDPTVFESIWTIPAIRVELEKVTNRKAEDVIKMWRSEIQPVIRKAVEDLIAYEGEEEF